MNKLCIDLCSGLGGFSQAFVDAGWEVIRVDYAQRFAKVPFTRMADVCDLLNDEGFMALHPTVIMASPPCERFSKANTSFPLPGIRAALDIVGSCLEIIARMRPPWWALENPQARLRWFIGKPNHSVGANGYGYRTVKPTDIWTNIPLPLLKAEPVKKIDSTGRAWARMKSKSREDRAAIPYGLSQTILETIESYH